MQYKFQVAEDVAVKLYAIPNLVAAATCPFVGIIADKYSIRVYLSKKLNFFLNLFSYLFKCFVLSNSFNKHATSTVCWGLLFWSDSSCLSWAVLLNIRWGDLGYSA